MTTFKGKTAIVLGASKRDNMGQVIADRLLKEGATVIVGGRDAAELDRYAAASGAIAVACDITDKADIQKLADAALSQSGRVDIAVNAAGWGYASPFLDMPEDALRTIMDIQFKGAFQFLQVMVGAMQPTGGSIIQISSATATIMTYNYAAYMGTKAGIDHVVRAVANEFGDKGIRVNSISPGLTETPMTQGVFKLPAVVDAFVDCYPLGRIGTSDDIAAATVWLASDECFMTGENLQVNGGLTLRANPTPKQRDAAIRDAQRRAG
ncbi:SDR family NAD(P)-dependent oxidoreductase [Niveispirillum fermenti]|uniref:SDR family NAD(P)-dependent oxidoreductase n=1 Tax=Niveispirillum fermenti TaxID=1233113 RepID=UPI003A8592BA